MERNQNSKNPDDLLSRLLKLAGNSLKNIGRRQAIKLAKKLGTMFAKKVLLGGVKVILAKTAVIWVPLLFILLIGYLTFSLIYGIPRTVAEDKTATDADRVAAFFGFSEDDSEGWDDIFETYEAIASRWDEGLDDFQKGQVQPYAFSWAILGGVDRIRNDPFIKFGGNYFEIDGSNIKLNGLYPPEQFIPIYLSAEQQYGVDWVVLASIHFHESTYSTYPVGGVSSAGAQGPMQFMPCTWLGWKHASCTGKGEGSIPESILSDPSMIKKYGGYGVDATGSGTADIWSDVDAIHAAAKYLNASGYHRDRGKAIFAYNHADWYVNMILRDAEAIHQIHQRKLVDEEIDTDQLELDLKDIKKYTFFNLKNADKTITPKPEETFEALRPVFQWKDSTITTTWEETSCSTDEDGETSCDTETITTVEDVKLLTHAKTVKGEFTHHYRWETIQSGKYTITKEINAGVDGPETTDYSDEFYDYLKSQGIFHRIDVDLVLELIELYDEQYANNLDFLDSLITGEYPTVEGSNGWRWPTSSNRVTSHFGPRSSPCSGCSTYHKGIDIGGTRPGVAGDPVVSMDDGIVAQSFYSASGGNMVVIDHANSVRTRYLHLDKRSVNAGQKVTKGQQIGTMGNTGRGTQVHLHFEVIVNGRTLDPLHYFLGLN